MQQQTDKRATDIDPGGPSVRLVHIMTVGMSLGFLSGQIGYMKSLGLDVHCVSSPDSYLDEFARREGVPAYGVEMPRRITPLRDLVAVWKLRTLLRQLRPDIVHAHTPKAGLLGMIAATLARVPVRIYHIRGLPLTAATGPKRALLRNTEKTACRLAHRVLCVSHSVRDIAVTEGLVPPEKIRVLLGGSGNGVDASARFNPARLPADQRAKTRADFGIPDSATVIGYIGRIVRDKGIIELSEAWRSLREIFPDLHLLVIGPFEPQDPVPADVEEMLRSDPRIHLAGLDWDTPRLYAAMDVVCLPTYREGFPNVPLEAAAMGLPVVATRIPGCMDAVDDGVTGTLVPARDAAALTEALLNYIQDSSLRRSHGEAGRDRVLDQFRREAIWEALAHEYESLLVQKNAGQPLAVAVSGSRDNRSA